MISKQELYCTEIQKQVEALVRDTAGGRGTGKQAGSVPIACTHSAKCPRTTFCRFVNPLTQRIPLTEGTGKPQAASPA